MKEVIISTEAVNSYGTRVLTAGIDISQYQRNPLLLWMHDRSYKNSAGPIGRIENLRIEGDRLIGTPVFDQSDAFAKQVEAKWEGQFLRMASAGLEILETSDDPQYLVQDQMRQTVTRSKLIEVSIVDMGANDESLQLYKAGKLLTLAAGADCAELPVLTPPAKGEAPQDKTENTTPNKLKMNKEFLQLLGLPEGATEEQALSSLRLLKTKADQAEELNLRAVTSAVDQAITERRLVAENRDHFIQLGKTAGLDQLQSTLKLMPVMQKPTDVLNLSKDSAPSAGSPAAKNYNKLSEVPAGELMQLRKSDPAQYAKLYKTEYGMECPALNDD